MILHFGGVLSLMGILLDFFPYFHSSLAVLIQSRSERLMSGGSRASVKDAGITSIIPNSKEHTVDRIELGALEPPHNDFGSEESLFSLGAEESEAESDTTRSVAESSGVHLQDDDTNEPTSQSRELLNEWRKELQAGYKFIENRDGKLWEILSALPVFDVIPWLFAMSISSEIHIARLGENDWSLMNKFPDKLLEDPEYFRTLTSEFSISMFPSLLKAQSALEYIQFGLEVEKMNNRINQQLLDTMEENPEIVPKLLGNSLIVNALIEQSYENFHKTTEMEPIDHVEHLMVVLRKCRPPRRWIKEIKAYRYLKAETKKRKEIYEKLEECANLSEFIHEIKRVDLFGILQRISTLITCKQIFFKYLERVNVPARLKKILDLAGNDKALLFRLETFDFSSLQAVRTISDLSQYEADAIHLQISAQRQILNGIVDGLKNEDQTQLLQTLTSVLDLVQGLGQFKRENPEFSLNILDHLEVLKRDFYSIWPLKPLFPSEKKDWQPKKRDYFA